MAFTLPKGDLYLTCQMIDREHKNIIYKDPELWAMQSHGYPGVPGQHTSLHLTAQQYTQTGEGVLRCNVSPNVIGSSSLNIVEDYPFNYLYIRRNGIPAGGSDTDYATTKVGAFITSAKWINTGLVEYTYEIDPIVTYYPYSFSSIRDMMVIRSNATFQNDGSADYDYIHKDVKLGLSEPWDGYLGSIVRKRRIASILPTTYCFILIVCTDGNEWITDDRIDRHRFGMKHYIAPSNDQFSCFRYTYFTTETTGVNNINDLKEVLKSYEVNNQLEGVIGLYYLPWDRVSDTFDASEIIGKRPAGQDYSAYNGVFCCTKGIMSGSNYVNYSQGGTTLDLREYLVYTKYNNGGGINEIYKPKFEKLCRYPYHYLEVVDKVSGANHKYQIENFIFGQSGSVSGIINFYWTITLFPEVSIAVYPQYYESMDGDELDRGFTIPACQMPFTLDQFEKWLNINKSVLDSQKQANTVGSVASMIGSALSIGVGVAAFASGVGAPAGGALVAAGLSGMAGGTAGMVNAGMSMKQNELAYEQQMKSAATMPLQTHTGAGNVAWSLGVAMPEIYEVVANPDVLQWADNNYMRHYGQTRATSGMEFDLDKEIRGAHTSNSGSGIDEQDLFIQTRGFYPIKVNSSHPGIRNQIADIFDKGVRIHTDPAFY